MTTPKREHALIDKNRHAIAKAIAIGNDPIPEATSRDDHDARHDIFNQAGAIPPPFEPEVLALVFEDSNSLRQNVDAYAVNIDGFGHRFEPAIELDKEDAIEKVRDAMLMESIADSGDVDEKNLEQFLPKDEDVDRRLGQLRLLARVEKAKLEGFFAFAAQDMSFPKLRKMTRQDLEITGNAYWEILRNKAGKMARFVYVPAWTVRLRSKIKQFVTVNERCPISPVKFGKVKVKKQFRTFVQVLHGAHSSTRGHRSHDGHDGHAGGITPIYFKDLGDPRVVSRETGKVFQTVEELKKEEPDGNPANEMIHFQVPSPLSPYGVPRWIGNLLSVLGSRSSEEVNYFYFENKAVPPLAILVSGGRLSKSSVPKIEDFIENNMKGKRNFHKILVIEAVSPTSRHEGPTPRRPTIELKPLKDAQQNDALFQEYDQANIDKVGNSFRLPRILRGESKEINRATAEAALRMAEDQVFQPERDDFDFFINHRIIPELGTMFWAFRSNSPIARNPEVMGKIVEALTKQGILTPEEARVLAGDIFNRDFEVIKEPWVKQPLQFTLAGIQTGQNSPPVSAGKADLGSAGLGAGGALQPAQGDPPRIPSIENDNASPEHLARLLLRIRGALGGHLAKMERDQLLADRDEGEVITLEVSRETIEDWVDVDGDKAASGSE